MVKDYKTNALKAFDFSEIVQNIPELQQLNCNIKSISFKEPIDSSNMNTQYYIDIVEIIESNYTKFDGFVILTGSDTMSYISSAVSFMLENLQKPIIFTGSQLPIGDLRTDAKENLITSIEIASVRKQHQPLIKEVCLYFEYKLYRANRTTKISAEHFEAFASMNYPALAESGSAEHFEAFASMNYPALAESGVHLKFNEALLFKPTEKDKPLIVRKNLISDVVILKLFPGITKATVEAILSIQNLKGVILESYGSGNAPNETWFINLLKKAIAKEIKVVNVTQCSGGSVILGHYDTSVKLKKIGVISGLDITTESAVAKLMYLLNEDLSLEMFKYHFQKSLRGEITKK